MSIEKFQGIAALSLTFVFAFTSTACGVFPEITTSDAPTVDISSPTPVSSPFTVSDGFMNSFRNEVNGIGIGSSYNEVIERFGKPSSQKKGGENPCGSARTVLRYKGISFTMDDDGEQNIVVVIEITSSSWEIAPGIRTGFTIEEVRSKMGQKGNIAEEEGVQSLGYADGDGYLNFYLENGRVKRITRELNMC